MNVNENFGESVVLQTPSYEYFGDIYAGLDPRNPLEGEQMKAHAKKKKLAAELVARQKEEYK